MLSHIRKYLSQNKENPTPFQNIIRMLPNPNLHCVLCFDVITKVVTYFITHKNDLGLNAAWNKNHDPMLWKGFQEHFTIK